MASQFERRKKKLEAGTTEHVEAVKPSAAPETYTAYDLFTQDGGRTFQVIILEYDVATQEAKILGTKSISRKIGLQFQNQKKSLKTLLHIKE